MSAVAGHRGIETTTAALIGLLGEAVPGSGLPAVRCAAYRAADLTAPMGDGVSLYLHHVSLDTTRTRRPPARGGGATATIDLHYLLTAWSPQTARQQRRLHRRRPRLENPADVDGGAGTRCDLLRRQPLEGVDPSLLAGADGAVPGAKVERRRRGPEPAGLAEVGVDPVAVAKGADLADSIGRRTAEPPPFLLAAELDQRPELGPPRQDEPAVAPARPGAAEVRLQQYHIDRRIELLEPQRRPQPGVTAADDANVGPLRSDEGGRLDPLGLRFEGHRLVQPERPLARHRDGL